MKPVFSSADAMQLGFLRSALEEAGIATYLQNEYSHNVLSAVPIDLFKPTLYVANDDDYERAVTLVKDVTRPKHSGGKDWTCPQCGEDIPGNFEMCWNCGAGQPY